MKHRAALTALLAALLLPALGVRADDADDSVRRSRPPVDRKAIEAQRKELAAREKKAAQIKRVDINSASKAELKKLPGIGDAEAERIVGARPYSSKFVLATDGILPKPVFEGIREKIVAKQPAFKDAAEVAAYYGGKKK